MKPSPAIVGIATVVVIAVAVTNVELAASLHVASGVEATVLQLDWLNGLIRSIDNTLENLLDLVRTIRALFGGGGD
jgi:small ligand-binding sensory domain FIST